MEQWEKNFYITALAGANNGSSLVVMSRGNTVSAWPQEKYSLTCMLGTRNMIVCPGTVSLEPWSFTQHPLHNINFSLILQE